MYVCIHVHCRLKSVSVPKIVCWGPNHQGFTVILDGSRVIADVINMRPCCMRVSLDPITDVLRKIRTQRHTQWRKSCEERQKLEQWVHRSKDVKDSRPLPAAGTEKERPSSEASGGVRPRWPCELRLPASSLGGDRFLSCWATQFELCYGSPVKLILLVWLVVYSFTYLLQEARGIKNPRWGAGHLASCKQLIGPQCTLANEWCSKMQVMKHHMGTWGEKWDKNANKTLAGYSAPKCQSPSLEERQVYSLHISSPPNYLLRLSTVSLENPFCLLCFVFYKCAIFYFIWTPSFLFRNILPYVTQRRQQAKANSQWLRL